MGRYLLIEFDDNESALKLKKQIDQATKNGRKYRLIGYFASPDGELCACDPTTFTNERGKPFTPSSFVWKTGWRKCKVCKLYRRPYMMKNLLEPEKLNSPHTYEAKALSSPRINTLLNYVSNISFSSRLATKDASE